MKIQLTLIDDLGNIWVDTETTATKAKAIQKAYLRSGVILKEVVAA
jgi:hypothetical protein